LEGLDGEGARAAGDIQAPPLAVAYLGYDRRQVDHPLDGLGFLTPQGKGISMSGAQFCSTMFPGRAPDGAVSMAGYFGAVRAPDAASLPTADLVDLAHAEFSRLLGIRGAPRLARVRHWPLGLPQYRLGHKALIECLDGLAQRRPGLFATGNYFTGPSVATCVAQAETRAGEIARFLEQGEKSGGLDKAASI
jgi:oxygen-dependent protoporphyrinogen oxidase